VRLLCDDSWLPRHPGCEGPGLHSASLLARLLSLWVPNHHSLSREARSSCGDCAVGPNITHAGHHGIESRIDGIARRPTLHARVAPFHSSIAGDEDAVDRQLTRSSNTSLWRSQYRRGRRTRTRTATSLRLVGLGTLQWIGNPFAMVLTSCHVASAFGCTSDHMTPLWTRTQVIPFPSPSSPPASRTSPCANRFTTLSLVHCILSRTLPFPA
jgi:hypothetical protein